MNCSNRNVTEFNYRIADQSEAHIFVGIGTQKATDSTTIAKHFRKAKFATIDLTHDELAKSHLRHMVGGRSTLAKDELYRFEFPERPGALMKFLTSMAPNWNISLFHYRNHGADYGRILVGLQVKNEQKKFQTFLASLGYPHWNETDNPSIVFVPPMECNSNVIHTHRTRRLRFISTVDFEEENRIFESTDDSAYMKLQLERLSKAAQTGVAFPFGKRSYLLLMRKVSSVLKW